MTAAAIIAGSLVDVKNVNSHKCMRLIIDVPAENALKVIAAFGWPTMVNPVSVAVARLGMKPESEVMPADEGTERGLPERTSQPIDSSTSRSVTPPRLESNASAGADKPKRIFSELPYPQQAALRCNDPVFWAFLREMCSADAGDVRDGEQAKLAIYKICDVGSRASILPDTEAEGYWLALTKWFDSWKLAERVA